MSKCTWIGEGEGCDRPVHMRSYCEHHYPRIYARGTAVRRRKDKRTADQVHLWESLFNEALEELEAEGFEY